MAHEIGTWWARRGIRARSMITSVAVVTLAFVLGGVGLVVVVRTTMLHTIEQSVVLRAQDAAAQVASDDADAVSAMAGTSLGDETVVQVINAAGTVLVESPSLQGEPPITTMNPSPNGLVTTRQVPLSFADGQTYLVAEISTTTPQGPVTVLAAQSLATVERVTSTILVTLFAVGPLLLAAVAAMTWLAVGNSLASVERIRRRVDDIDGSDLHERVPIPIAKDEIERLAVTMNRMLDRLERSMARQREFVGDASHELKTPLATMRASLDVSERSASMSEDSRRVLSEEVTRMTLLVSDLLTLARADEAAGMRRTQVDLDDLAVDAVETCARMRADVQLRLEGEPTRVLGDAELILRAVRNVVENAVRHARSQVLVTIGREGTSAVIVVQDDGPGIPAPDRQRVLERFVRLDEHRGRTAGGTGLGLAIAAEVVSSHDGGIEITDAQLGGAQVTLALPLPDSPTASPTGSRR